MPIIKLNVGGEKYDIQKGTLQKFGQSWFPGDLSKAGQKDDQTVYFIERDGKLFRYVFNFMINVIADDKLALPDDFAEWDQLEMEAEFYQLKDMTKQIKALRSSRLGK